MGSTPIAELLADVGLGSCEASTVAWCPIGGLIAVGARLGPELACVHLLNSYCLSRKVTLYVPLEGVDDQLFSIEWSPAGCRRVLLIATLFGKLTAWSQQPPDGSTPSHITLEDWWQHDITHLARPTTPAAAAAGTSQAPGSAGSHLAMVRWLLPRPMWAWSARVQQDFRIGSLVDAFVAAADTPQPASQAAATQRNATPQSGHSPASHATPQPGFSQASHVGPPPGLEMDEPGVADGSEELLFHWVRPGMLALAAVQACGAVVLSWATWGAYGQLQWQSTAAMQLPPAAVAGAAGAAVLQAVDAAVCSRGVAVCYSLQQEPGAIRVALLAGHLQHMACSLAGTDESPQLPVSELLEHRPTATGSSVMVLSWDPCSNGTRLCCITSGSGSSSGSKLELFKVQVGAMVHQAAASCPAMPHQQQQQQQKLVWLLDGLLLLSPGSQQLVHFQLDPLQQLPTGFQQPGPHYHAAAGSSSSSRYLQALAASPHGVAAAAVLVVRAPAAASSSSRLLVYNVPAPAAAAGSISAAQAAAGRLCWGLVQQRHCWDIVQHALSSARCPDDSSSGGGSGVQQSVLSEVMGLVDDKLSVQQLTLKSAFSVRWDVVKLLLLGRAPGSMACTISIDLRLRIISQVLRPVFDVLREEAGVRNREPTPRVKLLGLAPLHAYVSDTLAFHVACIKTWAVRRAGRAPDGGDPQVVPCVRHFLDWRPCNVLLLLYMISTNMVTGSKDEQLYSALKYAMKAAAPTKDPQWEQSVKALTPGPYSLHYGDVMPECLASFSLPPDQLLRHLEANAFWQSQPTLSDADIAAAATRLGLLPARSAAATTAYQHELQLHSGFRRQPQADIGVQEEVAVVAANQGCGRAGSMKRHRWQQMVSEALGDVHGPGSSSSSHVIDLAHMMELDVRMPGILQSVDGTVLTHDSMPALEDSKSLPKGILEQFQHGWVYACPISGEMWMHASTLM